MNHQTMFAKRTTCQKSQNFHHLILMAQKNWTHRRGEGEPETLFQPLLLTDCGSLFSAIVRIQPLSQGKCAGLFMNQLRDLQTLIDMSFAVISCNLGDVGAKHAASLNILTHFFATWEFIISFLGRKARLQLEKPLKND